MSRSYTIVGWFAVFMLVGACGDNASSSRSPTSTTPPPPPAAPPPAPSRARIAVSVSPNPVRAELATDSELLFRYRFTVTVSESAGVGGNVNFINETLTSATGARLDPLNRGAADVILSAGTNHVKAGEKLVIPLGTLLTWHGTDEVTSTIDVDFTDDLGNAMTETASFTVRLPFAARRVAPGSVRTIDALALDPAGSR